MRVIDLDDHWPGEATSLLDKKNEITAHSLVRVVLYCYVAAAICRGVYQWKEEPGEPATAAGCQQH